MSKFLMSVFIPLLLLGLLISGISCSKATIILPPSQTATPTQSATPNQTPLSSLDVDLHSVKTAVDAFAIQSGEWPTASGSLPSTGQYALIDFSASFYKDGKIMSFYPHFITKLPRHWDEGVWRIDSAALVSVDIDPHDY
jgi:hypothetical protein